MMVEKVEERRASMGNQPGILVLGPHLAVNVVSFSLAQIEAIEILVVQRQQATDYVDIVAGDH